MGFLISFFFSIPKLGLGNERGKGTCLKDIST